MPPAVTAAANAAATDPVVVAVWLFVGFMLANLSAWIQAGLTEKTRRKVIRDEFSAILEEARRTAQANEEGRRIAIKAEMASIVAEARQQAAAAEQGKRDTVRAEFGQILAELRQTTRGVEEIKASISDDLWTKQRVWQEKREAYFALIDCCNKFLWHSAVRQQVPEHRGETDELCTRFVFQAQIGKIFFKDKTALELVDNLPLEERPKNLSSGELTAYNIAEMETMAKFTKKLMDAARADLGVDLKAELASAASPSLNAGTTRSAHLL